MKLFLLLGTTLALVQAQTSPAPVPAPAEVRREVTAAPTNDVASMAISPDGRKLAFSGMSGWRMHLWLRALDSEVARPLPGTDGAVFPFWSPDSRSIGFFADTKLKRMDVETGATQTLLSPVTWPAGGTWNRDGEILFTAHGQLTVFRIAATGGTPRPVTGLRQQQFTHVHPQYLPDGRHFLYYATGTAAARGIYVGGLDGLETRFLVDSEAAGVYAAGRLLFVKQRTLFAQEFDPVGLTLSGPPVRLAEDVPLGGRSVAPISSANGHVIYRTGQAGSGRQLTWFDRSGKKLETVGETFLAGTGAPSISPDGNSVVVNRLVDGMGDIFTVDMKSGTFSQFASDAANDSYPVWSHDGVRILFSSNRTNIFEMYEKPFGIAAGETRVFRTIGLRHPMDWSRDGRYLLYRMNNPDLWALRTEDLLEIQIIPVGSEVRWPQFSPDGKWIAFQSNQTGRNEIHIRGPFEPPSTGQTSAKLSIDGGAWVRWRADGRELYYVDPDGRLMAVPIEFDSNGRGFKAGTPAALFATPMAGGSDNNSNAQQYMVAADGKRFLVVAASAAESPIRVILNWKPN